MQTAYLWVKCSLAGFVADYDPLPRAGEAQIQFSACAIICNSVLNRSDSGKAPG